MERKYIVLVFFSCMPSLTSLKGMKATIIEASKHISGREMDIMDDHYDILGSNGDIILPGLWSNTIKPGETVTMRMWPQSPSVPSEVQRRWAIDWQRERLMGVMRTPDHPDRRRLYDQQFSILRGTLSRPLGPSGSFPCNQAPHFPPGPRVLLPSPPPPGYPTFPPVPVKTTAGNGPGAPPVTSFISAIDKYSITEEEDKQLMVIDFVEELAKIKNDTIDDLLAMFTNVKDTVSEDCFKDIFTDSDSDSDDSVTSKSSGTSRFSYQTLDD